MYISCAQGTWAEDMDIIMVGEEESSTCAVITTHNVTHSNITRLELGKRIIKELPALPLVLLTGDVVALLDLLGTSTVVAAVTFPLHELLRRVDILVLQGEVNQGDAEFSFDQAFT